MQPIAAPEEAKLRRSVFLQALLLALQSLARQTLDEACALRRENLLACALAASAFCAALWSCLACAAFAFGCAGAQALPPRPAPALSVSAFACACLACAAFMLAGIRPIAAAWRSSDGANLALRAADFLCSNCALAFERAFGAYRKAQEQPRRPGLALRAVLLAAGSAGGSGALLFPFCLLLLFGSCAMLAGLGLKAAKALRSRPKLAREWARFAAQAPGMALAAWKEACAGLRIWAFERCPVPEPELAARCARKSLDRCAAPEQACRAGTPKGNRTGRL